MDTKTAQASPAVPLQNYASFGQRFAAIFLDSIVIGLLNSFISYLLNAAMGNTGGTIASVMSFALAILYYVLYQSSATQTLGKRVLKIKVVDENGKTPSAMTFFLREIIGKLISGIILGIGYLMMLWDKKKQTLHDKIASTYVVRV
ncbi:MAG: RDD family protein [bacterium]|nr:RDD family protein [bacterium]